MYGKSNLSRKVTPRELRRRAKRAPSIVHDIPSNIDVGDWVIAQDFDGSLIIHNVATGARVKLARP